MTSGDCHALSILNDVDRFGVISDTEALPYISLDAMLEVVFYLGSLALLVENRVYLFFKLKLYNAKVMLIE